MRIDRPAVDDGPDAQQSIMPDSVLVDRILAGDEASFELLMRRHNQRLYRAARAVLRDPAEAEDVVQEAYLRAFRGLDRFDGRASLATWLTRIAVHEAIDRRRRIKRSPVLATASPERSMSPEHAPANAGDGERAASHEELRNLLTDAVDALPEALRVVFVLREVEGLDTAETAACLDLSQANVKVRLHRARAALRESIDAKIGAEARRMHAFDGPRCDRIVWRVIDALRRSGVVAPRDRPGPQ